MQRLFQNKLDRHERQLTYLTENAVDFPASSLGGKMIAALRAEVALFRELAVQQTASSDDSRMHVDNKDKAFIEIFKLLKKISRAAQALDDVIPNLKAKFHTPRNRSQKSLNTLARTYYRESEGFESEFIGCNLPETFRADLLTLIQKIETTQNALDFASHTQGSATGGLRESIRRQSRLSTQIDKLVRNTYDADAAKIAGWEIASHLEHAPRRAARRKEGDQTAQTSQVGLT